MTEHTVVARDLRSALRTVRQRYGDEALIIETRTRRRPQAGSLRLVEDVELRIGLPGPGAAGARLGAPRSLAGELERLESLIAELDSAVSAAAPDYPLAARLGELGLLPATIARLAADHAEEVPPVEQAAVEPALARLAAQLPCLEAMAVADLRGFHALLGGPGAGRSALAMKLCARAAAGGATAAHLAFAPVHPGERLRLEREAMNAGHEAVLAPDAAALADALRYLQRHDLVVVDLPAFAPEQLGLLERSAAQAGVPMLLRHAVLAADGWARLAPDLREAAHYLAITRSDLADPLRLALDLTPGGTPLLSFVAGGCQAATPLALAEPGRLLGGLRAALKPARAEAGAGR
jgi:hypothetical protein